MPINDTGATAPGKEQNQGGMFRCEECGRQFPQAEMWEEDQCQMCLSLIHI